MKNLFANCESNFRIFHTRYRQKSGVFAKIRQNRGMSNFNTIRALSTPPFSLNRNGQPFFRRVKLDAVYHNYRVRKSINIVNQTRIFPEKNSWVLFSLETSLQKEVHKIQNIKPKHVNYSF
ncbi:hypothetical protein HZS_7642 [Henneguya salminicola]|nr:hypothetical protein HZS_7642 [Henneguya salminicola]